MNKLYLMLLLITGFFVSMPGYSSPSLHISNNPTDPILTPIGGIYSDGSYSVGQSVVNDFSDTWEFTLNDTVELLAWGSPINLSDNHIDSLGFQLEIQGYNVNDWVNVGGHFDTSATYSSLGIGSYRFLVTGTGNGVTGQGSYIFGVNVTSPVPLPQTWVMMLVGFAFLLGLRMNREKTNLASTIAI